MPLWCGNFRQQKRLSTIKIKYEANELFSGSIVALVTPMTESGDIDEACLKSLIDWHVESGTHGLVVMGTTGEASMMSTQEHLQVVERAIKFADGRIPIIVGCGSAATSKVINLVKQLNAFKPDGYLCVAPYYVKPTQKGLLAHFNAVANECDSPLVLYDVPSRTACELNIDTIIQLAKHENIVGIKDATGNLDKAQGLREAINHEFCFLSGDDETAFDYVEQGGDGVITVSGNIAPKAFSQWCHLLLNRDEKSTDKAKDIFNQLFDLNKNLFIESNPIPVKWALAYMKKINESIRLPLTCPEESSKVIIEKTLLNLQCK